MNKYLFKMDLKSYNFKNKSDSLNSCLKIIKGKLPKNLKNFLINNAKRDSVLIINDVRLRNPLIKKIGKSFSKIIVKKLYFRKDTKLLLITYLQINEKTVNFEYKIRVIERSSLPI